MVPRLLTSASHPSFSHQRASVAASTPAFAQASLEELDACLDHLKSIGFKLIVIDTPPAVTQTIAHVVKRADLVVVPTRPSPHDLRAVGPTVDIADSLGKALVFVVNSATPRASGRRCPSCATRLR